MNRAGVRVLVTVAAVVLCAGCAQLRSQPSVRTAADKQSMEQLVRQRQHCCDYLSALAQVKVSKNGKKWSSTQAIMVQSPNKLRLDMVNFFNQTMLQLAVADASLSAYVPSENTLYSGRPSIDNIQRFTGMPLPITDLVALLLLKLPPGVIETSQFSQWDNGLILTPGAGVEYWLTITDGHVTAVEYRVNSYLVYCMHYSGFENGYPHHLELNIPLNDIIAKMKMDDVMLNSSANSGQFIISVPDTTLLKDLNAL